MQINFNLNGIKYSSLKQLKEIEQKEVRDFLIEWYNDKEYIYAHTSGSTGKPKEIILSKADMINSSLLTNEFFQLSPVSTMLLCLSPSYIAGKMMIVRAIVSNANLITGDFTSLPLKNLNQEFDFAAFVPMQLLTTISDKSQAKKLNLIKNLIIGGAPLSKELETQANNYKCNCYSTYGMTETVSHVALRKINGENTSYIYEAIGNVTFDIDDRDCLIIKTPHLTHKEYITNDIVRIIDDRHFIWISRYDDVINSGGVKLFPNNIEQKICHSINKRFFITSKPDPVLGEKIVLVIEDEEWDDDKCTILRSQLKDNLHSYEIPKEIIFLNPFLETKTGKIIKKLS